jgi:uncharacterized protein DUF3352
MLLAALLPAALAGVLAGCGSSPATGTLADPAVAVPASTAVYVSATVRPSGTEATAALAAGRALTHQADPYLRLVQALQTPGEPALSFKRDVAPWLGPHAAIFLSSLSSSDSLLALIQQGLLGGSSAGSSFPFDTSGVQGAIVLDTSNEAKARSFLSGEAQHAGAHAASYRGVSYHATGGGLAFAIVARFAVIGSEAAVHSVIDTTLGGASLARSSGYSTLLASAPPGALAHIYTSPAGAQPGAAQRGLGAVLALLTGARPANVSLVPSPTSIALDADTLGSSTASAPGGLLSTAPQGARTLGELPGESWLAIGLGDVGSTLPADVQGLRGLLSIAGTSSQGAASGTLNLRGLLEGLFTPLSALGGNGAQARRDFQSWMGSVGIFASGGSLLELKGGVVIESKDPALSRAAVAELGGQLSKMGGSLQPASIPGTEAALGARLPGLPVVLAIAAGRSSDGRAKFVLGLGEASVPQALNPPSTLSAAASYGAASSALGEGIQPSIVFDVPTFLTLLEGVGLTEDPTISKFVPYLRTLTTIDGGGHSLGGDIERYRLVLGLNAAGG